MLYLIVAVLVGLFICLLYIFRLMRNRGQAMKQRRQSRAHPELPVHQVGPRPTFTGTAHEVADHMFPAPVQPDYVPFHRRPLSGEGIEGRAGAMFAGEEREARRRQQAERDLPAYSAETPATDTTLDVAPPPPAHVHERAHNRPGSLGLPTVVAVEPPKYTPMSP
ncbi:hypothetical protein Q5752_000705 [Cryptotrichosporon argae]